MKLNPDCIRDVLLYLEENLKFSKERDYGIENLAAEQGKEHRRRRKDCYPEEDYRREKLFCAEYEI